MKGLSSQQQVSARWNSRRGNGDLPGTCDDPETDLLGLVEEGLVVAEAVHIDDALGRIPMVFASAEIFATLEQNRVQKHPGHIDADSEGVNWTSFEMHRARTYETVFAPAAFIFWRTSNQRETTGCRNGWN